MSGASTREPALPLSVTQAMACVLLRSLIRALRSEAVTSSRVLLGHGGTVALPCRCASTLLSAFTRKEPGLVSVSAQRVHGHQTAHVHAA